MSVEMNPTTGLRVDLLGPTVEFLTSPQEASIDFCVLRGVIPPSVSVPLHSHPDTEDFFVISGEVQALRQGTHGYEWIVVKAGDHLHVPGGERHGWRNVSSGPLVAFIITTTRLGQFFQEVGRPMADGRGSCALPCALRDRIRKIWLLECHSRRERSGRDRFLSRNWSWKRLRGKELAWKFHEPNRSRNFQALEPLRKRLGREWDLIKSRQNRVK
jgi:quercetin dioxygenase-like cupin family protein